MLCCGSHGQPGVRDTSSLYSQVWRHQLWGHQTRTGTVFEKSTRVSVEVWRRQWQPTPVFLPGEPHGQRNLADCGPQGHKESHTTEVTLQAHTSIYLYFKKFWPHPIACGTLVPWPGIESITSGVESPNHWTTREFPFWLNFLFVNIQFCGLSFTFLMVPFEKIVCW